MNKLTPEQLVLLNRKLTESASEEKLLKMDIGEFEEMANIPYRKDKELFYEYNSTLKKAAVLGHLIVKREPFRKSNKETAVLALLTLLDINYHKMVDDYGKDIGDLLSSLEEDSTDSTCRWIEDHLDPIHYKTIYK